MLATPPFEIPPIVTYAVPVFVAVIIIEMIYVRVTGNGHADEDAGDQTGERAGRHASLPWRIRARRIMDVRGTGACGF